ncbi:MAG: PH domain-containing protein [Planctomycetes bacterium]|nr:PH domain-containing protein [Planctomycetota bacterium]
MPYCPHCGVEPSPGSNFCPKCGVTLSGRTPPRASSAGIPREVSRTPIVAESAIFYGHPRVLSSCWYVIDVVLLLTFGAVVGLEVGNNLCLAAACVGVLVALLIRWLYCLGITYRITTHRIDVDRGLFSKKRDVLWLYEVWNLNLDRPFSQRLMRTGNLLVTSFESEEPHFRIRGLLGASHIFDQLKVHVDRERQRHVGVIRALGFTGAGMSRSAAHPPEPVERLAGSA